jgi:hypothetical protein
MKKIYVIGDSFCNDFYWVEPPSGIEKCFWVDELKKTIPDYEIILSAQSSRDIQTIIEIWIRLINNLKSDDIIIICLPYFRRTRLPLSEENYLFTKFDDKVIETRFVGTPSYDNKHDKLEFWGNRNNWRFYNEKLEYQEMINTTLSNQKTTIEVIESLYELTNSKKYIFSWDTMDIKSNYIDDKDKLSNLIGVWETNQDDYNNSNGLYGTLGDLHWSHKMQKIFAQYIMKKFNL